MISIVKAENFSTQISAKSLLVPLILFLLAAVSVSAQTTGSQQTAAQVKTEEIKANVLMPAFKDFKGVKIGSTADEAREKLGKPSFEDETGFIVDISDNESVQVGLDKDKKVNYIAARYRSETDVTPKYTDIFGKNAEVVKKDDGSIYNLVRYPDAGYWVAYSRLAGDKAMVTVTMKKMP
jgi:hypothetical protein